MPPVVWPIEANGSEQILERYSYRTDVIQAYSRKEQRRKLKRHPGGGLDFSILCTDPRDAALANGLILQNQAAVWGVPLWPYGAKLTSDVSSGAATIPVITTDLPFQDIQGLGQYVLLWRDPRNFALHPINAVNPTNITILDTTARAWAAAGTYVVPVRPGRLDKAIPLSWQTSRLHHAKLVFSFDSSSDVVASASPPAAAVTYLGTEVLEREADGENEQEDSLDRRFWVLGDLGARSSLSQDAVGVISRPFRWKCATRAETAALRAFLDRRVGQLNAFWHPTGEMDLTPTAPIGSGVSAFDIYWANYSAGLFPGVGSRRHLSFRPVWAPGTTIYRKVLSAVDNGDGTEHLVLDAPMGQTVDPGNWLVSFMRLSRLSSDEAEISHLGNGIADATLPFVEIPLEAPL